MSKDVTTMSQFDLETSIGRLKEQLKPLEDRLNEILNEKSFEIEERLKIAMKGKGDFTLDELRFSRTSRCVCGEGIAYPKHSMNGNGYWLCSAILIGLADRTIDHVRYPFSMYEIKSENETQTTRPS